MWGSYSELHNFPHLYWKCGHGARVQGSMLSLAVPSRLVSKLCVASALNPDQTTGRGGGKE